MFNKGGVVYLLQWSTIIITTAPITADINETITMVRTQPSSPGASETNKHAQTKDRNQTPLC